MGNLLVFGYFVTEKVKNSVKCKKNKGEALWQMN